MSLPRPHAGLHAAMIREVLLQIGRPSIDSRHVEGYMRIEHPTLDGLSAPVFEGEVRIAVACIDEGGLEAAEDNAQSFGL